MAQSQRSIFLLDSQNDLRLAVQPLAALFASQAIIAALLIYPGKQIGLLLVCKPTFEGSFSRDDLSLCEAFAKQAANAMGQAQQQAELRETNVHFVQSFGHDMGGHTTIIAGYASLMLHGESGPLSDQQRTWLVTVRKHANQLTSLIRDVRNVAEIEFQAVRIRVSPVDLAATIRQAVVSLKANLDSRQQLLILDVPALPLVKADEWRLSQILVNLLSNASKFSPENGRITVSGSTQNSLVRVVVTDTGPGMDTEDQARLFTRGFCAKLPPEYRELCGNGVGLYIAKNLIELMGGQIGFESEPGKGSTFWFTVPVADSAENPLA
jgi:signal transduction histidine kinase